MKQRKFHLPVKILFAVLILWFTVSLNLINFVYAQSTDESSNIGVQDYNPGFLFNASNRDVLIIDEGNPVFVKPGAWYNGGGYHADDVDGIWAKCSSGESECGSIIPGYRLFKTSGAIIGSTTYRVYNYDWNDDNKLALNENQGGGTSSWQHVMPTSDDGRPWTTPGSFGEYSLKTCGRLGSEFGETCPAELPHTCNRYVNGDTGVVIYTESNCLNASDKWTFNQNNQSVNLAQGNEFHRFEDNISSIKVTPNWSIKVYANYFTENEPWTCINNSRWDLNSDPFERNNPNGIKMAHQISSFKVFNNTNCGESLACSLPNTTENINPMSCGGGGGIITNPNACVGKTAGNYCGSSLGMSATTLFRCSNNTVSVAQTCNYGCNVQQQGVNDFCNPSPSTSSCPNNRNGKYCGSGLGSQYEQNSLYNCVNGTNTKIIACALGCIQKPAGTDDVCRTSTGSGQCPSGGNGNYCGLTVGLDPNNLYTCTNGSISLNQTCNYGCKLNNPGTPDVCYPQGEGGGGNPGDKVKLYGNSGYDAGSLRIEVGSGLREEPERGAWYKSMHIPSGWSVVLSDQHIGLPGASQCFSSSVDNLELYGSWANSIESMDVRTTNVCPSGDSYAKICRGTGQQDCMQINTEAKSLSAIGFGNDTLKSLDIHGDWLLLLFEHENYEGQVYEIGNSVNDLGGIPFGYGTSSIQIRRRDPAAFTLYRNGDYNDGNPFKSDRSIPDLTKWSGGWNDAAQSMRVGGGYEVIGCSDAGYRGTCARTTNDVSDLNSLANGLRNGLSSIQVCLGHCPPGPALPMPVSPAEGDTFLPGTAVSLSWSGNADDYTLEYWGGNMPSSQTVYGIKDTMTWTKPDFAGSANPYYWHVKAWNPYGNTVYSETRSFKVQDIAPTQVYLNGDDTVNVSADSTFTALASPSAATNLTYTWAPEPKSGQGTSSAVYNWNTSGLKTISITVQNTGATVNISKEVNVTCPSGQYYAQYFDNKDLTGTPLMQRCEQQINYDWGAGGPQITSTIDLTVDSGQTAYTDDIRTMLSTNAASNQKAISVSNSAGFTENSRVFVVQMIGSNTGTYEYAKVESVSGNTIALTKNLTGKDNSGSGNVSQIIKVPEYNNVTINGTLTVHPWDGQTGGVLIIKAFGTFTVNGNVDLSGKGYRGGERRTSNTPDRGYTGEGYPGNYNSVTMDCWGVNNSNGNGGGSGHGYVYVWDSHKKASGGGGAGNKHEGAGGQPPIDDGYCGGYGGNPVGDDNFSKVFMGGGAGSGGAGIGGDRNGGAGGDGGGIIFIDSATLNDNGEITSNGTNGENGSGTWINMGGGGGGGAGGSILLKGNVLNIGNNKVKVVGGLGGAPGPENSAGGNGSIGRIRTEYCTSLSGTNPYEMVSAQVSCGQDNFSARWTSITNFEAGKYTFKTDSDDGVKLWIDGNLIIDRWVNGIITEQRSVDLTAGNHEIKVEYFENTGNAHISLSFAKNAAPTISSTPVNTIAVYTGPGQTGTATYQYNVIATDPDLDTLSYSLTNSPKTMTIDSNGLIRWDVNATQMGDYNVSVVVNDGINPATVQTFTVTVGVVRVDGRRR